MAFHTGLGLVLMFGGIQAGGTLLNDTWSWNGSQWNPFSTAHQPTARNGQRVVYYPDKNYVLLFGGNVTGDVPVNDTWTLDGGDWVQRTPTDSPSNRCCVGLAYFGGNQKKLFLFGGGIFGSPSAVETRPVISPNSAEYRSSGSRG